MNPLLRPAIVFLLCGPALLFSALLALFALLAGRRWLRRWGAPPLPLAWVVRSLAALLFVAPLLPVPLLLGDPGGVAPTFVAAYSVSVFFAPFDGSSDLLALLLALLPRRAGRLVGRWIGDLETDDRRRLEGHLVASDRLRREPAIRRWLRRSSDPHVLKGLLLHDASWAEDVGPIFERFASRRPDRALQMLVHQMTPHQIQQVRADTLVPHLESDDPAIRRTAFRALGQVRAGTG